jgi:hypothetical protein
MSTTDVANIMQLMNVEGGKLVGKIQPLCEEVVRQYQLQGLVLTILFSFMVVWFLIVGCRLIKKAIALEAAGSKEPYRIDGIAVAFFSFGVGLCLVGLFCIIGVVINLMAYIAPLVGLIGK